jgi:hypothetical protein
VHSDCWSAKRPAALTAGGSGASTKRQQLNSCLCCRQGVREGDRGDGTRHEDKVCLHGHSRHSTEPACAYSPEGHAEHVVALCTVEKRPAGHGVPNADVAPSPQ